MRIAPLAAVLLVGAAVQVQPAEAQPTPCPVTITMGGPGDDQSYQLSKEVGLETDADGSGDVSPGDTLRYTVRVVNLENLQAVINVLDSLPAGVTYVPNSTNAAVAGGLGPIPDRTPPEDPCPMCGNGQTFDAAVGPGQTAVQVDWKVTVNPDASGDLVNIVAMQTPADGAICSLTTPIVPPTTTTTTSTTTTTTEPTTTTTEPTTTTTSTTTTTTEPTTTTTSTTTTTTQPTTTTTSTTTTSSTSSTAAPTTSTTTTVASTSTTAPPTTVPTTTSTTTTLPISGQALSFRQVQVRKSKLTVVARTQVADPAPNAPTTTGATIVIRDNAGQVWSAELPAAGWKQLRGKRPNFRFKGGPCKQVQLRVNRQLRAVCPGVTLALPLVPPVEVGLLLNGPTSRTVYCGAASGSAIRKNTTQKFLAKKTSAPNPASVQGGLACASRVQQP